MKPIAVYHLNLGISNSDEIYKLDLLGFAPLVMDFIIFSMKFFCIALYTIIFQLL